MSDEILIQEIALRDMTIEFLEAENNKLLTENDKLREEAALHLGVWAVKYSEMNNLDGLHPQHYDRLKELGARLDDFKRAAMGETK